MFQNLANRPGPTFRQTRNWEIGKFDDGEISPENKNTWVFPKIGGKLPKWMVYNGKPYQNR